MPLKQQESEIKQRTFNVTLFIIKTLLVPLYFENRVAKIIGL